MNGHHPIDPEAEILKASNCSDEDCKTPWTWKSTLLGGMVLALLLVISYLFGR